ncbi:hypothetical protein Pint_05987 [Pistacia integerrima]|uniref:Uncharacterized protein n=1 Tax=Pistacia integerrima TaxID=434235 RepID=A0ACC0Z621_9ROSI|nr:hypothetical protein Pint_05987 [Pistacia integerrima]
MVIKKKNSNTYSDEDDEIFYYRYASTAAPNVASSSSSEPTSNGPHKKSKGSKRAFELRVPEESLGAQRAAEPKNVRQKIDSEDENENESAIGFDDGNWASVVDNGAQERLIMGEEETEEKKEKVKRVSYFSDESGEDD